MCLLLLHRLGIVQGAANSSVQNIQRNIDKREIVDLVRATKSTVLQAIPADPDLASAMTEDVRKQKVEVMNWKFWKKMDAQDEVREKLKAYCRRYEKMLLKHSKVRASNLA